MGWGCVCESFFACDVLLSCFLASMPTGILTFDQMHIIQETFDSYIMIVSTLSTAVVRVKISASANNFYADVRMRMQNYKYFGKFFSFFLCRLK